MVNDNNNTIRKKIMTIDDNNTPIPEPTDEELEVIEEEVTNPFEISEDEYDDMFGDMPTTDKGLGGAKWRERLDGANNFYNNPNANGFLK